MATHSRILAWEIPWTEAPGGLQSMGSQRVRHDLAQGHEESDLATKQQQQLVSKPALSHIPGCLLPSAKEISIKYKCNRIISFFKSLG